MTTEEYLSRFLLFLCVMALFWAAMLRKFPSLFLPAITLTELIDFAKRGSHLCFDFCIQQRCTVVFSLSRSSAERVHVGLAVSSKKNIQNP